MSHWTLDGCPTEDIVAAFVEDSLEPDEREALEAHLDACSGCRVVVSELVKVFAGGNEATLPTDGAMSVDGKDPSSNPVAVGASVGRYRVLQVLGMGGMGIVYLAHDPELDRKVAVKIIRRRGYDEAEQSTRLLREARAMAKLSHPNVIAVHDVGTWNEQVFVAMEYVDAGTLKGWMKETPRTWKAIRPTLIAAGRGLAAAHEAGLVHRDFKPDNVLLSDRGRVFVTDFGLARWSVITEAATTASPTLDGEPCESTDSERFHELTKSGAFVGTPAYMAPEQFGRTRVGPACDQFAFCVVLWEALFGVRPFEGRTLASLAHAVCETPTPAIPATPVLPRRVRTALLRGLAKKPEDRFPSMQTLLNALGPVGGRHASWGIAAGLGAVAIPLTVLAVRTGEPAASPAMTCADLTGLHNIWSEDTADRLTEGFGDSGLRTAPAIAENVRGRLDAYAQAWSEQEQSVCQATANAELDESQAALQHQCLGRARIVTRGVIEGLMGADAKMVRRATQTVLGLPNVEACTDAAQLSAEQPPLPPEAIASRVAIIRDAILLADAEHRLGRYGEGLTIIDAYVEEATSMGFRPLQAEVGYARGRLLVNIAREDEAARALEEAELHGIASRYTSVVAKALILHIYAKARQRTPWAEVEPLVKRAEAALDGTTLSDPVRSTLYTNAGIAAFYADDLPKAIEFVERGLAMTPRDIDPMRWAATNGSLISFKRLAGDIEDVIPRLKDVIEVNEQELGPTHPDLIESHRSLANAYKQLERYDEARATANRALSLAEETHGTEHFEVGGTLSTLSAIEGAAERYEAALDFAKRSSVALEAAGRPTQIPTAQQAEWLIALERPAEAAPLVDDLIEDEIETHGAQSPGLSWMYFIRCSLEASRHDVDATRAACDAAIDRSNAEPKSDTHLRMKLDRAEYLAMAGANDEAFNALLTLESDAAGGPPTMTTARFHQALALQAQDRAGRDNDAHAWMQTAREQFLALEMEESVREVDAWLATRK
ncbi:MAG: protein kinase [Nannocystaceae bacterium]|nr:protein kinase [Nannocystaceae bacterium]